MTDEQLHELSDEELEALFNDAKYGDGDEDTAEEVDEEVEDATEEEEYYEEEEVEEDDDLEQPNEDSDDDARTEEDTEGEEEDDSEADSDTPDGETEDEDEQTEESEDEVEDEVQPVQKDPIDDFLSTPTKSKANGRDYEFTNKEKLDMFDKVFGQSMDYTKKMQAIKPWRKAIDALESENVSQEDLNLMIDVLKGDKEAINEVVKRAGIDTLELDTENSSYTPKDYGRNESELAIKDVIKSISADKEYSTTQNIIGKEWDEASWQEMTKNPSYIAGLHEDVKSGVFNEVQAIADVVKLQDGGRRSDLEYYGEAARIYGHKQAQENARLANAEKAEAEREKKLAEKAKIASVKAKQNKAKVTKQESVKRKAAAPTKRGGGTKKVTDYLDDSDEAYDEWYKNLQDSR